VCRRSLAAMQTPYFDLYLLHAPFKRCGEPFSCPLPEVWRQMEALVDSGLAKAIGVSNWRVRDLKQIVDVARIQPACNQVEAHPYLQQPSLRKYCTDRDIVLSACATISCCLLFSRFFVSFVCSYYTTPRTLPHWFRSDRSNPLLACLLHDRVFCNIYPLLHSPPTTTHPPTHSHTHTHAHAPALQ
jgi:diketogulonate reductase-like aldo/keto reductase